MSKCPVYREAIDAAPWKSAGGAHAGLIFDKFPDAWDLSAWKFDKEHENAREKGAAGESWLTKFTKRVPGDRDALREACDRQTDLIHSQGGEVVYLKNVTRFVTGMGREHPLENGFTWHHTLGVPYLPGTGVKGVLRAWLREQDDQRDNRGRLLDSERVKDLFGSQESASRVTLLDMLPTTPPRLAVEIMTPHYGPYYQEKKEPGDWHSPVPISYLAVEKGATWQLGILPAPGQRPITKEDVTALKAALLEALDWLGAGAKTATGYGQFEEDKATADAKRREAEERRKRAEDDRQRKELLSTLSPQLADLHQRAYDEGWATGNEALLSGLEKYRAEVPQPDAECIAWLRDEWLEKTWAGIWANPDKTSGKKSKPAFKDRPRNIVKWLKLQE